MNERELIERYNQAWNDHDLDAICSLHAPGFVFENHTAGERAEGASAGPHRADLPELARYRVPRPTHLRSRRARRQRVDGDRDA